MMLIAPDSGSVRPPPRPSSNNTFAPTHFWTSSSKAFTASSGANHKTVSTLRSIKKLSAVNVLPAPVGAKRNCTRRPLVLNRSNASDCSALRARPLGFNHSVGALALAMAQRSKTQALILRLKKRKCKKSRTLKVGTCSASNADGHCTATFNINSKTSSSPSFADVAEPCCNAYTGISILPSAWTELKTTNKRSSKSLFKDANLLAISSHQPRRKPVPEHATNWSKLPASALTPGCSSNVTGNGSAQYSSASTTRVNS
mmetsp:Transcript_129921/g.416954  ORF Transcript_129921/g.416954 Transcript_129921/m.416954 type:complete len:258 (-) Transcript_129921:1920-2693(-)